MKTGRKIMIVEDESIIAFELKISLMKLGYVVTAVVNNGNSAIESAQTNRPDLILMDINIKGHLDGIETANQILAFLDVPIIYLTAYANKETMRRAQDTRHSGYILKPFIITNLNETIIKALQEHEEANDTA